jgi:hypothetical protein
VLQPLAFIPEHSAIVLNVVQEPTLRARLLQTSRTRLHPSQPLDDQVWDNAGSWLRAFHDRSARTVPPRLDTPEELLKMYEALCDFLLARDEDPDLLARIRRAARKLTPVQCTDLAVVPGHGDYVANNMFADSTGRITVFDPLSRWLVPRFHDLATLTVGVRVLPLQAASQGHALDSTHLDRYEAAVLRGYFGSDAVPLDPLRAYQLLVLLDRWCALLSKRAASGLVKPQLRRARVRVANYHFRREAQRLLAQAGRPQA